MNLLPTALDYLAKNWPVIPCRLWFKNPGDTRAEKIPLVRWKPYQDALPTPQELTKWFTQWPTAQLGLVTGPGVGLMVVDIDLGATDADIASLQLPTTLISRTPSGGRHVFLRYPKNKKVKTVAGFRPHIDIRGEGGFCFTAGHKVVTKTIDRHARGDSKVIEIEKLKIGDLVKSYNEKNGFFEWKPVTKIGKRVVDETVMLKFGQRNRVMRCTPEHPIYTTTGWKDAGEIMIGEELFCTDREQLGFPLKGHKFAKGRQHKPSTQPRDYQKKYRQSTPSHKLGKSGFEKFLESLAAQEELPIKFVGDGSVVIRHGEFTLRPDFIVAGKKKLIEVHCDWHSSRHQLGPDEKRTAKNLTPEERVEMYEKEGWECLYLNATKWQAFNETTLEIIEQVRKQIVEFVNNGKRVEFVHRIHEKVEVFNIEVADNHNYFLNGIGGGHTNDWYIVHNCVIAPSKYPNGVPYEWLIDPEYADIAEAPEHLLALISDDTTSTQRTDYKAIAFGAPQGQRNHSAAVMAGCLLLNLHPSIWNDVAWPLLRAWNKQNSPPLEDFELLLVFNSIARSEWCRQERIYTTQTNDL